MSSCAPTVPASGDDFAILWAKLAETASKLAETEGKLAESEGKLADTKGELADAKAKLAESEDERIRRALLQSLTALVTRSRNIDGDGAIKSSPETTALSAAPTWKYDPSLFSDLSESQDPTGAVSDLMRTAVKSAKCTPADPASSERPSDSFPSPNDVHSHVRPAVDAVIGVLANTASLPEWDDCRHPRHVVALYEKSYNNHTKMPIPDHTAVLSHRDIPQFLKSQIGAKEETIARSPFFAQLSSETQIGVIEDKTFQVLHAESPCEGEIQLAGYVAQPLFPPLACGTVLAELISHPLSSFGVYTDSTTATLVEVRVSDNVEVFYCRMSFLPCGGLPTRTSCAARLDGAGPSACGIVAFGLGIMSALRDARLRATGATAEIISLTPMPDDLAFPRDSTAPFLGRGKHARVFKCVNYAVKVPHSRQAILKSWSTSINAEVEALQVLLARSPPCLHFPRLAVPVPAESVADGHYKGISEVGFRIRAEGASETSASAASVAGTVQGLVTTPVLSMLPQVINELRAQLPLVERSVGTLVAFSLAFALPLLSAQAHARSCGLSQGDAHSMNIGVEGHDVAALIAFLRFGERFVVRAVGASLKRHDAPSSSKKSRIAIASVSESTPSIAGASSVDHPISSGLPSAFCRSVILNDWGSARACGVAHLSVQRAVALDTSQVVALVGSMLRLLLDGMTVSELCKTDADSVTVQWFESTMQRCRIIALKLQEASQTIATGDKSRQYVLQALGLAPTDWQAAPASTSRRSTRSASRAAETAAASLPATASSSSCDDDCLLDALWGTIDLDSLCAASAAAAGCACYNGLSACREAGSASTGIFATPASGKIAFS